MTAENTKSLNEQIDRIARLFKLQLGVCLDNIESTLNEFKQFDESRVDERTMQVFREKYKKYKELEPFELALVSIIFFVV